jgi:predicted permease
VGVSPAGRQPLDWRAVGAGALLTLAVALPPTLLVRVLKGDDLEGRESNLWVVPVLAIFAGFALGGHLAARRRPVRGLQHAAAAAGVAFLGAAAYSIVRHLVTGDGLSAKLLVSLVLLGTITISVGILGGYVAVRRSSPSSSSSSSESGPS